MQSVEVNTVKTKIDQATDTRSIEEFIKELIRKEFQHLLHEISDEANTSLSSHRDEINKGVANIVDSLRNGEDIDQSVKKDVKSFSRVKINGNNKPLLQITFSRSGENSLQVLDNCVNVTICDSPREGREKLNTSLEETLVPDDVQLSSLKRCQTFNAIQVILCCFCNESFIAHFSIGYLLLALEPRLTSKSISDLLLSFHDMEYARKSLKYYLNFSAIAN